MKKVEAYRVEIPIVATDEYSREMDKANKAINDTNKKVKDGVKAQDNLTKSSKDVAKAQDNIGKSTRSASKGVESVGKSAQQAEKQVRRTTRTFESFGSNIKSLQRAKANIQVAVKDNATRVLTGIQSRWSSFRNNPITRLTVSAVDRARRTLQGIKNTVLSIPTMITIGLSYVGVKSLGNATAGAAMNWEQYEVSMEHWLDGNTKKAKELTKWMGEFADITPFSSPELFPALVRAVSVTDKDLDKSKRLLRIASDMAALTPDRTVEDAMSALASSKMGNTAMLEAYGLDVTKKQMDDMGGWDKLVDQLDKKFAGGAEKLSKTAAGVLATLKGYRGSFMRSIGTGFLDPMKPRLDAINKWLENNQETWGRWKNVAMGHGKDLSEGLFSTLEKGFGHVRNKYLDNPEFMKLDLKGKIGFISDDVGGYLNSTVKPKFTEWWDETGSGVALEIGKSIGSGIVEGIKLGIQAGAEVFTSSWSDLFTEFKETGFSKETGKSLIGAMATTMGAGYLGKKMIFDPGRAIFRTGKNVKDWTSGKRKRETKGENKGSTTGGSTVSKIEQAEKRRSRIKIPKNLSKLTKGIPFVGAGVSALSLFGAKKEDIPGVIGGIGGGLAGAKLGAAGGAAIGSVVPGIGTAIGAGAGGLIGGIGGAMGGNAAGDWLSKNWGGIVDWTKTNVWEPFDLGFKESTNFVVGLFDIATESIQEKMRLWSTSFGIVSDTLQERMSMAWIGVQSVWGVGYAWFQENFWSPTTTIATTVTKHISDEFGVSWSAVESVWSSVGGWFKDNVWAPLQAGASSTASVIGEKMTLAMAGINSVKNVMGNRFDKFKTGVKTTIKKVSERGAKYTEYARGGIATSPHLGLVAEAGVPEAMIPWDGSSRSKALWQQTGEALGMFDSSPSQSSGDAAAAVGASGGATFNFGDISVSDGNNMSAEEILNLITPVMLDKIKAAIAKRR